MIPIFRNGQKRLNTVLLILALLSLQCGKSRLPAPNLEPPRAQKIPKSLVIHGLERIDNYYWLNQRDNPEVLAYLEAENRYLESYMRPTEKLQNKLYKEIIARFQPDDESIPFPWNGYSYITRYQKGKEYPVHYRRKLDASGSEELLLDVNQWAEGHTFCSVTGLSISDDNKIMAFGLDTVSRRKYTLYFKELSTGNILADRIPNTTGFAVWAADNKTIFYVTKDSTLRPHKIYRHILGTDPVQDVEIHHEEDNTFDTHIERSKSGRFLFIVSGSTLSDEVRYLAADNPAGSFRIIQPRTRDLEYRVEHQGDWFYILTNDRALNFRIMRTPIEKPGKGCWEEVIPSSDDALLTDMDVFQNYLVTWEEKAGLSQINVLELSTGSSHTVKFDEEAYDASQSVNREYSTQILRYQYSSMTTPSTTFDYDMSSKEKTLLKQEKVLGGFRPENYRTRRLYAPARDGVQVPISLVYREGLETNGTNPCLLYGYGSYGASMTPRFNSSAISLLDRGFVYAIAHIRGGQEMGRKWYEDGKLLKKVNTFTDFIDCADFLAKEGYTSPEKLCCQGGSAGGLLIGAVVNMRPDLFAVALAGVPFVDVVTTMLDESIPLTTGEFDEWGNPNVKKYYDYMLSYSPYDNVSAQNYPAMLVTTGLHDSQVQYFEPAKWVAKLREFKTDKNPLLFHVQMEAGHGGASGRFARYKRTALEYAFMFYVLGIQK